MCFVCGEAGQRMLSEIAGNTEVKGYEPKQRKLCTGHFGKIYALHWGSDSRHIVTASQDGKLIVWNGLSGNKQLAITLNSAWVMTCAFSPSYDYIASGGLDNTVSIFRTTAKDNNAPNGGKFKSKVELLFFLKKKKNLMYLKGGKKKKKNKLFVGWKLIKELYRELEKHDGYLSCARFVDESNSEIISSSGDGTCILWDIENRTPKSVYADHTSDVMCVSLNQKNPPLFVSGSVDSTAKVWDTRKGEHAVANFTGHTADVNSVQWFPDANCVITGSDDGSVRLFDIRSYRQINHYVNQSNKSLHSEDPAGVTSVAASKSGHYIFTAYDNGHVYMWSTLRGDYLYDLPHDSRVSCLGVSDDGYALATGCWDFNLRVFA
ncbi:guanine nucleotide-binding protein beta subunit [Reticulomyxa filosa]|uniref:Guanine nucleotide-binding protein beta subunit n=1 Tax=Reticulomyxa filosa TaxID=46433 RepID=X6MRF0_RETFI|nr:guanine nucleotide-binding protein beta subunit [Reticulomyxa filosa]|eukprot:ETO16593.1 guanine nucleotide-binding protein beta subunit [Reticulomyxa filosa]